MQNVNCGADKILHNYNSVCIPVRTNLNIPNKRKLLYNYEDVHVCDFLEFGWPINHDRSIVPKHCGANYKGVNEYLAQVELYLKKEVDRGSAIGPFNGKNRSIQNQIGVSPLNAINQQAGNHGTLYHLRSELAEEQGY